MSYTNLFMALMSISYISCLAFDGFFRYSMVQKSNKIGLLIISIFVFLISYAALSMDYLRLHTEWPLRDDLRSYLAVTFFGIFVGCMLVYLPAARARLFCDKHPDIILRSKGNNL